jgi:hypothetical protein
VLRRHPLATASLAIVLLVVLCVGARLAWVHAETGVWAWSTSDARAPSRIELEGRAYDRGLLDDHLEDGAVRRGETPGGAPVYALSPGTQTLVWVVDGDDVWRYGLVGGP